MGRLARAIRSVPLCGAAATVQVQGRGDPLLLIHGLAINRYTWRELIAPLSRSFQVHAIDLFGCGDSLHPGPISSALWCDQLVEYLDVLDLRRTVLVGASYGAALGAVVAARKPERVRGLTLVSPVTFVAKQLTAYRHFLNGFESAVRTWVGQPGDHSRAIHRWIRRQLLFHFGAHARVTSSIVRHYTRPFGTPEVRMATVSSLLNRLPPDDVLAPYLALGLPTLVVCGRHDPFVPSPRAWEPLLARCPKARFELLPGGHSLPETQARKLAALIADHFART